MSTAATTARVTSIVDPPLVHEHMMMVGVKKAHLKPYRMVIMGVMSGFYVMIAVHGIVSLYAGFESISTVIKLLGGLIFSLALMAILLAGGELFTSNCLLITAVLSKRIRAWEMAVQLTVVYFSNFLGSIIFSVLIFGTGFYGWGYGKAGGVTPHSRTLCNFVDGKASPPAYEIFFRGILANFCVCLAVLHGWSAGEVTGRIIGMMWPIAVFMLSGYEHSIANQGFFALATIVNCPTNNGWYWLNLLMSTAGNLLGAWIIGLGYYFVTLWDTDKCLAEVPTYEADGYTIVIDAAPSASDSPTTVTNASAVSVNEFGARTMPRVASLVGASPDADCVELAEKEPKQSQQEETVAWEQH